MFSSHGTRYDIVYLAQAYKQGNKVTKQLEVVVVVVVVGAVVENVCSFAEAWHLARAVRATADKAAAAPAWSGRASREFVKNRHLQ